MYSTGGLRVEMGLGPWNLQVAGVQVRGNLKAHSCRWCGYKVKKGREVERAGERELGWD